VKTPQKDTFLFLKRIFELPELEESFEEEQAILILSKAISQLLDRDFERLLQICYRIDLGEEKAQKNPPRIRTGQRFTGLSQSTFGKDKS